MSRAPNAFAHAAPTACAHAAPNACAHAAPNACAHAARSRAHALHLLLTFVCTARAHTLCSANSVTIAQACYTWPVAAVIVYTGAAKTAV